MTNSKLDLLIALALLIAQLGLCAVSILISSQLQGESYEDMRKILKDSHSTFNDLLKEAKVLVNR